MSQELGLGYNPESIKFLFVGEAEDETGSTPWYEWNHDTNTAIPVHYDALTGYINNITIVTKQFKGSTHYKIQVHVTADRRYRIQVGAGTVFARGLVLALAQQASTKDAFKSPLTITVKQGDDSKAVFAGVFDSHGQKVIAKWDSEALLMPIVQEIQAALGQVVQTKEMIDDPELYKQAQREEKNDAEKTKSKRA